MDALVAELAAGLGVVGITPGDSVVLPAGASALCRVTRKALDVIGAKVVEAGTSGCRIVFVGHERDIADHVTGPGRPEQVIVVGDVSWWTLVELGRAQLPEVAPE